MIGLELMKPWCEGVFELGRQVVAGFVDGTRHVLELLAASAQAAGGSAVAIVVSPRQRQLLEGLVRRSTVAYRLVQRARIILALAAGETPTQIAQRLGVERQTVYKWAQRWRVQTPQLQAAEAAGVSDRQLRTLIEQVLGDAYRRGRPATCRATAFSASRKANRQRR